MTSHDVVNRVRRITGERRVGHAGTLDPMATGVLVVLVGPATRLAPYLTSAEKTYEARIAFGAETDTDDAEGRVTLTAAVPDEVCDPFAAAAMVASLVGVHEQIPPAYSAIKRGGVVAYEAARKGEALELEPRTVEVASAELLGVQVDPPAWDVAFAVSKGTYIRALARDLGRAVESALRTWARCDARAAARCRLTTPTRSRSSRRRRRLRAVRRTRSPRSDCRCSPVDDVGRSRGQGRPPARGALPTPLTGLRSRSPTTDGCCGIRCPWRRRQAARRNSRRRLGRDRMSPLFYEDSLGAKLVREGRRCDGCAHDSRERVRR